MSSISQEEKAKDIRPVNNTDSDWKMKIVSLAALFIAGKASVVGAQQRSFWGEFPITATDVFIQSVEISASSANINGRCNREVRSKMALYIDKILNQEAQVGPRTDFTYTFEVDGLESNTEYSFEVTCIPLSEDEEVVPHQQLSFLEEVPLSVAWKELSR